MATAATTQREILRLRKYNFLKQLVDLDWEEALCQDIRRFFTRPKKRRKFIQKRLEWFWQLHLGSSAILVQSVTARRAKT